MCQAPGVGAPYRCAHAGQRAGAAWGTQHDQHQQPSIALDTHPRVVDAVMCDILRAVHEVQQRLSVQAAELANDVVKQHGRY